MKTLSLLIRTALALCVLALPALTSAQAPSPTYNWYGEVVAVDAATRSATVRLLTQEPVGAQTAELKASEKIVVVWQPLGNEADHVVYVARESAMTAVDYGFILHAEFVSADKAANTVTVKTAVPDSALAAAQGAVGKWLKVTMPRHQGNGRTAATAMAATAKPDLKAPVEAKPKTTEPNPTGPVSNINGTWEFETSLAGNTLTNECAVKQEGTTLSGDCKSMIGTSPLSEASVAGNTVKFTIKAAFGGMPLVFVYSGVVEPDGKYINGDVTVFGQKAAFTGSKR